MNIDDLFGEPVQYNPEWGDIAKKLDEAGFFIKMLRGNIIDTDNIAECLYLNNRQPQQGDMLYSHEGQRLEIFSISGDDITFKQL